MSTEKKIFGQINNKNIYSYTIKNSSGAFVEIIDFGCRIRQICVPDKNGISGNIVRCCDTPKAYMQHEYEYDGALIGRCANRVKDGMFLYNNILNVLTRNEGVNHVHGGISGFHNMLWSCTGMKENELLFSGFQKHMSEGYPGNIRISASYKFTEENELVINLTAQTDRDTVFNPTLHPFFNLYKPGSDASLHFLKINADYYTPTDKSGIPTGEIAELPEILDFRKMRRICSGLQHEKIYEELINRHGYDHNYIIKHDNYREVKAAELISVESGRKMEIYSTSPGLQFYSGNFMSEPHTAVCLEPQYFPDAINHIGEAGWQPEPILKSGLLTNYNVRYRFSVIEPSELKLN